MFEIEVRADGTCDVRRDRRAFQYDCIDIDEATRLIRQRDGWADPSEITVIEPDGYKTTLDRYSR